MRVAARNARRQQLKVHLANKARLDKSKLSVRFAPVDLVMYYDHTYDTEGVSKLQWLYSGPHVIERKCSQSNNLYWIRRYSTDGKVSLEKVNVNRLVLADNNCGDVGPALGWGTGADEIREQPTRLPERPSDLAQASNVVVGDVVALRMEPDEVENLPFAVGEVVDRDGDSIVVWWYGPTGRGENKLTGVWKPGFVDPKDNKRYYRNRKLHNSHPSYTSTLSETHLTVEDILGRPFQLVDGKKIPSSILATASADPSVKWSLPKDDIMNVLLVQ